MAEEDPYVKCPRCKGECQVFAYTKIGDGFTPSQGEYFTCPTCHGTGERTTSMKQMPLLRRLEP